jgi:predicted transcriptional regulator
MRFCCVAPECYLFPHWEARDMTATTTTPPKTDIELSLDEEMKARLAAVAAEAGQSADAFARAAIIESVERAEEDTAFHKLGAERWAEFERTGLAISWEETKVWLEARARGENPPRPPARKIAL